MFSNRSRRERRRDTNTTKPERRTRSNDRFPSLTRISANFSKKSDVNYELSFNEASPGVLKVFGASLQMGSEYKSILISTMSTATEVIQEVLERYGISRRVSEAFDMCEAVGTIDSSSNGPFVEQCCRLLEPYVNVSNVKDLWKPKTGFYRRFEIRRKIRLGAEVSSTEPFCDGSNETANLNTNARKYAQKTSKLSKTSKKLSAGSLNGCVIPTSPEERAQTHAKTIDKAVQHIHKSPPPPSAQSSHTYVAPAGPCLFWLRTHSKSVPATFVELRSSFLIGKEDGCDLVVQGNGVSDEHCIIQKMSRDTGAYSMIIESIDNSAVLVNGAPVQSTTVVNPGDLLSIGPNVWIFMNKETHGKHFLSWYDRLSNQDFQPVVDTEQSTPRNSPTFSSVTPSFYDNTTESVTEIMNRIHNRVNDVFKMLTESQCDVAYSAAAFASLCHFVSALNDGQREEDLQWEVSEYFCGLSQSIVDLTQRFHWTQVVRILVDRLRFSYHIYSYFKANADTYQQMLQHSWSELCQATLLQVYDDLVALILENISEYVDSLLVADPFKDSHNASAVSSDSMQGLLATLSSVDEAFAGNPDSTCALLRGAVFSRICAIISLQCTRKIISNTATYSLWMTGVKLRGNLDALQAWLAQNNLFAMVQLDLELYDNIVNLLATPKAQLASITWQNFRVMYPCVHGSILKNMLSAQTNRPISENSWKPNTPEAEEANSDPLWALERYFQHLIEQSPLLREKHEAFNVLNVLYSDDFVKQIGAIGKTETTDDAFSWHNMIEYVRQGLEHGNHNMCEGVINRGGSTTPITLERCSWRSLSNHTAVMSATTTPTLQSCAASSAPSRGGRTKENRAATADALKEMKVIQVTDKREAMMLSYNLKFANTETPNNATPTLNDSAYSSAVTSSELQVDHSDRPRRNHEVRPASAGVVVSRLQLDDGGRPSSGSAEATRGTMQQQQQQQQQQQHQNNISAPKKSRRAPSPPCTPLSEANMQLIGGRIANMTSSSADVDDNFDRISVSGTVCSSVCETDNDGHDGEDDIFVVSLNRSKNDQLGFDVINGMNTERREPGIYIKILQGECLIENGRIRSGDRLLAVNGQSLAGVSFKRGVQILNQQSGEVKLLIARSNDKTGTLYSNFS